MTGDQNSARDMILAAAIQVLQDEGPAKLTQTRVAKVAGLRQGHLTYYFPRKSDLWIATAARAHDEMEDQLSALLSSAGFRDAGNDTRSRITHLLTEIVTDHQRTRMMLSLVLQAQEDPEVLVLCQENVERSRTFLRSILGAFYPKPVVEITLAALWGLGMRDLVCGADESNHESAALVAALFEMLESLATQA